jgi:hypothetical protein
VGYEECPDSSGHSRLKVVFALGQHLVEGLRDGRDEVLEAAKREILKP